MNSSIVLRTLLVCAISLGSVMAQHKKAPQTSQNDTELALRGKLIAHPHDRDAHDKLCKLLEGQYKYRKVVEERKAWLEDNPDDYFELISLITTSQVMLFDPEYALAAAKQFPASSKPGDDYYALANDQIGRLLIDMQRFAEAVPYLEVATKSDPKVVDYLLHLSRAYEGAKQLDEAIAAARNGLNVYPSSAEAHIRLGDALGEKGDLSAQETEYKAACSLNKDDPLLKTSRAERYVSLARLQIRMKEYSEAETSSTSAIQLAPDDLSAYLVRARAMELSGQVKDAGIARNEAETAISQMREKEKKPPDMTVPLSIFAFNDSTELVRLLEPHRENLSTLETALLGAAYFDTGRPEDGESEYKKVFQDPHWDTAQSHFEMAVQMRNAGWAQKARTEYAKAYEMDPENWTYRYAYEREKSTANQK